MIMRITPPPTNLLTDCATQAQDEVAKERALTKKRCDEVAQKRIDDLRHKITSLLDKA